MKTTCSFYPPGTTAALAEITENETSISTLLLGAIAGAGAGGTTI